MMIRTHDPQQVHPSFAKRDVLPALTPIVGDHIRYLRAKAPGCLWNHLTKEEALERMQRGTPVYYETWMKEGT